MQQLETLQVYLDSRSSAGSDSEFMIASFISEKLISMITEENGVTRVDLNKLKLDLEALDRTANPFLDATTT